jgi:prevent-host-death family protein
MTATRKTAGRSDSPQAKEVSVHEAKTHLSRLLDEALAGTSVVVTRRGKPVVRLEPVRPVGRRVFGGYKGKIKFDDRFFEPLPDDLLAAWGEI